MQTKNTFITLINYDFISIPTRRKKVLIDNVGIRLEALLYEKAKELECKLLAREVIEDYAIRFV
ncbi:transposase [Nostoc flagelliforme FACHB-838]|uniref:Transposase n=1 Tax=Nostoc flagelliforme FACHB-838 TaxID=2692904 RepID=A0ABR8DF15_9NOSO|nr:transposase [Nostoc flagelliforme FACHB-838]